MKIKPFKLKKISNDYKPLIFLGNQWLVKPKLPLRVFFKINPPNLQRIKRIKIIEA